MNPGEDMKFTRGEDPKSSIGIGIKAVFEREWNSLEWYVARPFISSIIADKDSAYDVIKYRGFYILSYYNKHINRITAFTNIINGVSASEHDIDRENLIVRVKKRLDTKIRLSQKHKNMPSFMDEGIRAKKVFEDIHFERGQHPKVSLGLGMYNKYMDKFIEELTRIKGRDGFPWECYEDYVYNELKGNIKLEEMLLELMEQNISPKEAAEKMHKFFKKGMVF